MSHIPRFAKFYLVDKHQVLVQKDFDTEEEKPIVKVTSEIGEEDDGSVIATLTVGFPTDEGRAGYFDTFNEDTAREFLGLMYNPEKLMGD